MAHQIRAISKERLKEPYGELREESTREKIREAVQLYLDLPHK
jgi:mRNA-degrading endonuclease toxin of MazEF toxin-antitoxin module